MQKKVFVDTSTLILLSKINKIEILHLVYGTIFTTKYVLKEYGNDLPKWIVIDNADSEKYKFPTLGKGEESLCSLAIHKTSVYLILDDLKARKVATLLNINFTGTIGVLIAAKKLGFIHSIKPILEKINLTNFRLSLEVQTIALSLAGEEIK